GAGPCRAGMHPSWVRARKPCSLRDGQGRRAQPALMRALFAFLLVVLASATPASARLAPSEAPAVLAEASAAAYGPFRVLDQATAALVDVTDEAAPAAFRAMLRDHPGLATLVFVECPGTYDDRANLALGRLIRAAGLVA